MKNQPKPNDHYLYHNHSTGRWHEMIVADVIVPSRKLKLFADQDMRKTVVIMLYLEDVSNTRMYFYMEHFKQSYFKKADINWRPL